LLRNTEIEVISESDPRYCICVIFVSQIKQLQKSLDKMTQTYAQRRGMFCHTKQIQSFQHLVLAHISRWLAVPWATLSCYNCYYQQVPSRWQGDIMDWCQSALTL